MVNKRVGDMRREVGGGTSFEYQPAKAEFVKRQTERRGGRQFDSIFKDRYMVLSKLQDGDNRLRILPATWTPHDDFAYVVWVHKYVADRGSYLCPLKMKNNPCPLCEEAAQARKDKDEERAREWSCSELMVCWVLDRRGEFKDQAQLWGIPPTLYKDINVMIYDSDTGDATQLDNPKRGFDLKIKRTGVGLSTRYLPMLNPAPTALSDDSAVVSRLLKYIKENPVPDCLEFKSAGYLEKIVSGAATGRDEEEEEKEEPRDEEEEEEDHEREREREADAEEEEARQHARRRDDEEEEDRPRRKKAAAKDDEEDPPFGDEEERPRRGRSRDEEEPEDEDDRPRRKSKARDEEEPEDEDDRPRRKSKARDEDEDDRPKPKRSSNKSRRDEEEEEEDLTPRRARFQRERA